MNIKERKMKGKSASFVEFRPMENYIHSDEKRRNSFHVDERRPTSNLNKKMERYRCLLAKEYQLRFKLERQRNDKEIRQFKCSHCCRIEESKLHHNEEKPNHFAKYRRKESVNTDEIRKIEPRKRPLSADSSHIPVAALLRKEEAKIKAERRRASLQSLEEDFTKYKTVLSRTKALSLDGKADPTINQQSHSLTNYTFYSITGKNSKSKERPNSDIV